MLSEPLEDFGAADGSEEREASLKLLENFPAAPALIYLDLNIAPAVADPNAAEPVLDFGVTLFGGDGQPLAAVPCALGGSQMIDRGNSRIAIQAGAIYTHIVLEAEFVAPVGWVYKAHIFLGLTLFLVAPFTRLVHVWSIPMSYLWRPYQVVRRRQPALRYGPRA